MASRRTSGGRDLTVHPGTPDDNGVDRKGINSVEVGLRVVDTLAAAEGALALKDISDGSGLSRSQTHRYLTSLVRSGMVTQDQATGLYDLGPMALRVGLAALGRIDPIRVAEEALDRLVERIEETSMLAVWGERGPIAVRWRRGKSLIFSTVGLGTTFPLLRSTTGQLFLAYMPRAITNPLLVLESAELPADEIESIAGLIGKTRDRRYTSMEGHLVPGVWSASAPVFDSQNEIVAGLTIVGNAHDSTSKRNRSIKTLLQTTTEASVTLGWKEAI